ncbi:BspA family leucine-rich repeat surface protein [Vibrio sagamiensis]|uniref:Bacterial repeat domain-containing protein n=1 Tax=Vibrio sagamiensis NBRC 104589 TaxID=1219064 RepID=A0A511QE17_9VIBR|nr:BspA family leucine-rich repeat surface protein [Vibrio sagamiensis]GEM74682.1 hypothetical protein VSA01S_07940 [Vibrio sagamiensis NBRC 104589]
MDTIRRLLSLFFIILFSYFTVGCKDSGIFSSPEDDSRSKLTPLYNVTVVALGAGDVTPESFIGKQAGSFVEFTATPEEGYLFDTLNGNCFADLNSEMGDTKTFSVGPLQQDCDFEVTFVEKLNAALLPVYNVVVKVHGEGKALPQIQQKIEGEKAIFTLTPEENYKLASLNGDCFSALIETHDDTKTFSVGPLSKDCEIEAHFSDKNFSGFVPTYTVNINAVGNGQVSLQQATYLEGEFATFTASPDEGYRFKTITGDCFAALTVTDGDNRTFNVGPLTKDCFIDVAFTEKENSALLPVYELAVTASANGTVSPSFQEVLSGNLASFTVKPNDGYRFEVLEGNCLSALENSSGDNRTFTIGPFDKNCSLHARFIEKNNTEVVAIYSLETNLSEGNGQIQPAFQEGLAESMLAFSVTPSAGSKIAELVGTCPRSLSEKNGDTYIFQVGPMHKSCIFDVSFAEKDNINLTPIYEVAVNTMGQGQASPDTQKRPEGEFATFDAIPNEGFRFDTITGNCFPAMLGTLQDIKTFTVGPLKEDCEMNVNFTEKSNDELIPLYQFKASIKGEGQVDPAIKIVLEGESVTYTASPNEGYRFEALEGNCFSALEAKEGDNRTFKVGPFEHDCTLNVSFVEKESASLVSMYDVAVNLGEGGTVSTQNFYVEQGSDVLFTVSPEPNYRIGKVESTLVGLGGWKCQPVVASGDDDIPTQPTGYMVRNVSGNCGIKVTFFHMMDNDPINTIEHVKVSFNANSGGSIDPNHFYAEKDSDIEFTVTPLAGYRIDNVESVPVDLGNETCEVILANGDDGDITTATTYTMKNLQDDCEVSVDFGTFDSAIQEPEDVIGVRINVVGDVKGSVSKNFAYPEVGEMVTFNVNPTSMFSRIKSVTGDTCSVSIMSNDFNPKDATDYITDAIDEPCQISVQFEKVYVVMFSGGDHGEINITNVFNGSETTSASGTAIEVVKGSQVEFTVKVDPGYEFSSIVYYNAPSCGIESFPLDGLFENEEVFKTAPILDFCQFELDVVLGSNPVCIESGNQLIKVDQNWTAESPVPAYPTGQNVWAVTNATIKHPLIIKWLVTDKINIDTTCVTDMSNLFNREYYDEDALTKFRSNPDFFNGDVSDWVTRHVTNMSHMFKGNKKFNNEGIESWDVSNVTSMEGMFANTSDKPDSTGFNRNLSNWDVSKVTTMKDMFNGAKGFNNADTTLWNNNDIGPSHNLINTSRMFYNAKAFNQDISSWDIRYVSDMSGMFKGAARFNNAGRPLWNNNIVPGMALDPEKTLKISGMFDGATSFNQPINNWNISQVTSLNNLFHNAFVFNQSVNDWDTEKVVSMYGMFDHASKFNSPLNNWDVSNVVNMSSMFKNTKDFDQDITGWDVSNVKDMSHMFENSFTFNQDISDWKVKLEDKDDIDSMFWGGLHFDQNLTCWNVVNIDKKPIYFESKILQSIHYPKFGQAPASECNNN